MVLYFSSAALCFKYENTGCLSSNFKFRGAVLVGGNIVLAESFMYNSMPVLGNGMD